jgi:hypothetical protein
MKKILIVAIIVLVILIAVLFGRGWFASEADPKTTPKYPEGNQQIEPIPDDEYDPDTQVVVRTPQGSTFTMTDFSIYDGITDNGQGFYHYEGSTQPNPVPYSILYNKNKHSFSVGLLKEPFASSREAASQALLRLLGVTASELCQLNIYVGVTYHQAPDLSGRNLGLSVCPNHIDLTGR